MSPDGGEKFCGWLHKAQYFAKHVWNKTPDELMIVAEDMRQSYCSNFGEYIEKGMRGNTLSLRAEARNLNGNGFFHKKIDGKISRQARKADGI